MLVKHNDSQYMHLKKKKKILTYQPIFFQTCNSKHIFFFLASSDYGTYHIGDQHMHSLATAFAVRIHEIWK